MSTAEGQRDAVIAAAQVSLVRVALAFGLTNALVPFLVLALGSGTTTEMAIGFAWVVGWLVAVFNAPRLLALLSDDRTRVLLAVGVGAATIATITATGGLDSPLKTGGNWLGWAATVATSAAAALSVAAIFSVSITAAFLLAGSTVSELFTGADRYVVITGILNPFVVVLVALALAGVFRSVIAAAPDALLNARRGGTATSPGMTALFRAEPIALLTSGRDSDGPTDLAPVTPAPPQTPAPSLSDDEQAVVDRLASGLAPKQIALDLGRSTDFVYERIATAKSKAGARTIEQLVVRSWEPAR